MVQIVQDFCDRISGAGPGEDGFNIILMITQQHCPEHDQHGIEKGVAVFFMTKILNIEIFQHIADLCIAAGMKDQIISLRLAIQYMSKKLCQGTVCCQ